MFASSPSGHLWKALKDALYSPAWEEHGLLCRIIFGPFGNYNGYVGVPKGHPLFGKDYSEVDHAIDVHGGLTYSADHAPLQKPDGLWWFGFDTSHAHDGIPGREEENRGPIRTRKYVQAECKSLAQQLVEWKPA